MKSIDTFIEFNNKKHGMGNLNTRNIEPENENPLKGTVLHEGDIISPIDDDWEADSSPDDSDLSRMSGIVASDDPKLSDDKRREKALRDKHG